MKTTTTDNRILALDIMRGITIAGMILVNNAGSGTRYAPLAHAEWNGLTPTDLVFPFFMFIMGISTYISLRKFDFRPTAATIWKIIRRTVVIFAIGLGLAWLGLFLHGILSEASLAEAVFCFDRIRILGVLPRLALCYGMAAIIAVTLPHRMLPALIATMLAAYAAILILGNGYDCDAGNILSRVDRALLGENHMHRPEFDPEGILSTLPSVAHVLIGFWCGILMIQASDNNQRIRRLFIIGTILTFAGFMLDYGLPVNKKVWSPSFVLVTCGMASSSLALLIWIIDIKGRRRWCTFFRVFGMNPLFLYVLAAVMAMAAGAVKVMSAGEPVSVKRWFYDNVLLTSLHDPYVASLAYSILFVLANWIIGYILYKKKIYIKI
ncbi:MAG: heparan-alpha-glucosaminide N-acetyltransferase domain-containing protein [Muribaculaceae bacterium]|nr:heparan-alpha-glucosaminide N-acetyltransferase domain-containing protein [Muribaculaceae bacterium]